jgi:hypothetical protein
LVSRVSAKFIVPRVTRPSANAGGAGEAGKRIEAAQRPQINPPLGA